MITTKAEARNAVWLYRLLEAHRDGFANKDAIDKEIISRKREVRAYFNREEETSDVRPLFSDYGREITAEVLPAEIETVSDARDWFRAYRYCKFVETAWDCNGSWSSSIRGILKRESDGRIVLYIDWYQDV